MMKKWVSLLLALCLCLGLIPTAALAAAENFSIDENGVLIWYNGHDSDVVIPDGVTAIGDNAFRMNTDMTGVTIPDGVTAIGQSAFEDCRNLTSVIIPDSVTSIGGWAFQGCYSLTSVTIPGSVTTISSCAFDGCRSLTGVTISNGVTTIEDAAFRGCASLTGVTIPDSVTTIGGDAFRNCTSLTSVTIPDSVTSFGSQAFDGCTSLASVTVPSTVSSLIHSSTFPSTTKVTLRGHYFDVQNGILKSYRGPGGDITIPGSVTRIYMQAFENCTSLTGVTIPGSVTVIDPNAFSGCTGLTSVTIPDGVTEIGRDAFKGCTSLTAVSVPNSVGLLHDNAFPSTTTVTRTGQYFDIQNGVLKGYRGPGGVVTIPSGVTTIGERAFDRCTSLTGVIIPDGVTTIDNYAFRGCTGLKSVTIPDSVTTIGYQAFDGCSSLKSVTIPDSVTSLADNAFPSTTQLTMTGHLFDIQNGVLRSYKGPGGAVVIPDSVTKIGDGAFEGCTGLTSIAIPDSVSEIGNGAFDGCAGLKSVTIPGSVTRLMGNFFSGCTGLTSLTISPGVKNVSLVFDGCPNLTRLSLPDSVETLHLSSDSLRELVIPAGVTEWPYLNCPRLTKLTFPRDNWVFKGVNRSELLEKLKSCPRLNELVNCPNEYMDDLIADNAALRDKWTDPRSAVVAQSARITKLSNEITVGCATDYDKAKAISQWVHSHIKYDYDYYYEGLKDYSDVPFDPEEILDKGKAVCAGFSRLTQALLSAQGIPCLYVHGWSPESYHAWNLVYIDGEYLWIDNTWGMEYFCMGIYAFSEEHQSISGAAFNGVKGPGTTVDISAEGESRLEISTSLLNFGTVKEGYEQPAAQSVTVKNVGTETITLTLDPSAASDFEVGSLSRTALNGEETATFTIRPKTGLKATGATAKVYNELITLQSSKGLTARLELNFTVEPMGVNMENPADANSVLPQDTGIAYPSNMTVDVDGRAVSFQCYALKDASGNDTNYIKLRDLADILNGTKAQFQVGWSGNVTMTTGQSYTRNGSEQKTPFSGQRSYVKSTAPTYVNGTQTSLAAFLLNDDQGGGYTYYQLRDLGKALGFNVGWSAERGVYLETGKPYDAND